MKNKKIYCLIIIFLLVVGIFSVYKLNHPTYEQVFIETSWAHSYENVQELTKHSDVIAVVNVLGVDKTYEISGIPMTDYKVEVIIPVYGLEKSEQFLISQTGGILEKQIVEVSDDPLMDIGSEYFIFGRYNDVGTITLLGGPQGRFIHNNGKITNLFENSMKSAEATNWLMPDINFTDASSETIINEIEAYLKVK